MSWSVSLVLVNEGGPGYLGSFPKHLPDKAERLIRELHLGLHEEPRTTSLWGATTPEHDPVLDRLMVGAYENGCVLGRDVLVEACLAGVDEKAVALLLSRFPTASILALKLYSVARVFGYAYYERGECLRRHAGSGFGEQFVDQGRLLTEERAVYSRSYLEHGRRWFPVELKREVAVFDEAAMGEELALELSRRFFGSRLDEVDLRKLELQTFAPVDLCAATRKLQRIWSRSRDDFELVRTGEWLYAGATPQPVQILKYRGNDLGLGAVYQVVFGDIELTRLDVSSHGPLASLDEAVAVAEDKAASEVRWLTG